jgi:hypothetical protein
MRLSPTHLNPSTSSAAERRIFEGMKAADVGPEARGFHSLALSEHHYKIVGELDFVIVWRRGLYVLEVKGGRVSTQNGMWTYQDRWGRTRSSGEGPFHQARSGLFSLLQHLKEKLGLVVRGQAPVGFGVIFPDIDFDTSSVEWSQEMVLDRRGLGHPNAIARYLNQMADYWSDRVSTSGQLDEATIAVIGKVLRPDFERVPSLRARADDLVLELTKLTEDQFRALDGAADNQRLLVRGGAGTGKTLLAAEVARRHALAGQRTILVCPSPLLAALVRSRLAGGPVHVIDGAGLKDAAPQSADVLVVDEGQDLMTFEGLEALGGLLRGGLERGWWRVFLDPNTQAGVAAPFDKEALAFLEAQGATWYRLKDNCRNTKAVALQTRLCTGADVGNPMAGEGPRVEYAYFRRPEDQLEITRNWLTSLARGDVRPGDVTILSTKPYADSIASRLGKTALGHLDSLTTTIASRWPPMRVTFSTVFDFKGLENDFIILMDVDAVDVEPGARSRLYVGMSRARVGLYVAISDEQKGRLARVQERYFKELQRPNLEAH